MYITHPLYPLETKKKFQESVAQATGKPLFSVSVSDVGTTPKDVEQNLEILFELAATWGAVMLL